MANEPQRVYWDSCVYISCIEQTQGRADILRSIIKMAEDGDIVLVASTLVIAEVVKLNGVSAPIAKQAELIRKFF